MAPVVVVVVVVVVVIKIPVVLLIISKVVQLRRGMRRCYYAVFADATPSG